MYLPTSPSTRAFLDSSADEAEGDEVEAGEMADGPALAAGAAAPLATPSTDGRQG